MACPNKNIPDWGELVNKFGEDGAYMIFMKNDERVPYLQGEESNRFIWNLENDMDLVFWKRSSTGKNIKKYKGFDGESTANKVASIRDKYVGNYIIRHIQPNEKGDFGLKVEGYPLLRSEVEQFSKDVNVDFEEAMDSYKDYMEFKERETEANEDIIPVEYYNQRDILYNNSVVVARENERFNEAQIKELETILRSTMPDVTEIIWDRNLEVKGKIDSKGVISINPDTMTKDTVGHEFGHLLIDLRGGLGNKFILEGYEQLKDTERAQKIRETYKDQTEEVIQKEILADAIGKEVADIFEQEEAKSKFEKWLLRFFRWLGTRTGITKNNARKMASDMLKGEPIKSSYYTGKKSTYEQRDLTSTGDITSAEAENIIPDTSNDSEVAKTQKMMDESLDEYQKVRNKALNIVRTRMSKAKAAGRSEEIGDLEELLYKIEEKDSKDEHSIIRFASNAIEYINREFSIYQTNLAKKEAGDPEAFNLRSLNRWHDILMSYDMLDDILKFLTDPNFLGAEASIDGRLLNRMKVALQDAISKKNTLRDLYKTFGADQLAEALGLYSSRIIIQKKNEKRAEWAEKNKGHKHSMSKAKELEDEYAEQYIKENISELVKQSKLLIRSEMDVAADDVSKLTMWVDTMLDTNDIVLGAATKKLVLQDLASKRKSKEFKDEAWPIVQELYKKVGYVYGKTNMKDVYDFMLEKIDNKHTGYIINKFSSKMSERYEEVKLSNAHLEPKDASSKNNKWLNENAPVNKLQMEEDLRSYMEQLVKEGKIKKDDIEAYYENELIPYRTRPKLADALHKDSADGAALIQRWKIDNRRNYRNPIAKWVNPKWAAFEKSLEENPNSPETMFYNLIMKNLEEVNLALPADKRKETQLPFKLKDTVERYTDKQSLKGISKDRIKDLVERRIDDTEMGQYTDENDKPIDYLPYYYNRPTATHEHVITYNLKRSKSKEAIASAAGRKFKPRTIVVQADSAAEAIDIVKNTVVDIDESTIKADKNKIREIKWDDSDQSYDLMGLYYDYFKMANRYNLMNEILPEIELAKRISEGREYIQKDSSGNVIMKKLGLSSDRPVTRKGIESNLAEMFESFVAATMYGQEKVHEGSWDFAGYKFDKAKVADNLNKFTAYNMLGLNVVQGIANVSLGELQQATEAIAGEYFSVKDLHQATVDYAKDLDLIVGDVGEKVGSSVITHLNEEWDILNEYDGGTFKKNSKFAEMMSTSSLFFMSNIGEHFMQSRIMIAMLKKKKARNKDGKVIGNMFEMYSVENGKLTLNKDVDLKKSGWESEDRALYGAKIKRLLAKLHGEYDPTAKNKAQRFIIGRLGFMFRKFVVPGYKKRWQKKQYNEFLEEETEGSYRRLFNFIGKGIREMSALKFASLSENWGELAYREKANILRGASELTFGLMIGILASAFITLKGESDDDKAQYAYAAMAVLASRVRSEAFFFINPSETLTIVNSPTVASNTLTDMIKLATQVLPPYDVYERGNWKDYPKIVKSLFKLTPGVKQYYKIKNIEDTLVFFTK